MIQIALGRGFSSKVTVIAGTAGYDLAGARLMQALGKELPGTEFGGIGGKHMEKAGLKALAGLQSGQFVAHPWVNYERFHPVTTESKASFIAMPVHYRNSKVLKAWRANPQASEFAQQSSAFVVLGN